VPLTPTGKLQPRSSPVGAIRERVGPPSGSVMTHRENNRRARPSAVIRDTGRGNAPGPGTRNGETQHRASPYPAARGRVGSTSGARVSHLGANWSRGRHQPVGRRAPSPGMLGSPSVRTAWRGPRRRRVATSRRASGGRCRRCSRRRTATATRRCSTRATRRCSTRCARRPLTTPRRRARAAGRLRGRRAGGHSSRGRPAGAPFPASGLHG
jgi:hypothetical protein